MEALFNFIKAQPEYAAFIFTLINALWLVYSVFNKQRHDKELKKLEQELKFVAEKRLKIFDLKHSSFASYTNKLDSFGKKQNIDLPKRIVGEFKKLSESDYTTNAFNEFSRLIQKAIEDCYSDLLVLKHHSNELKLIATDEMLETFNTLEQLNEEQKNHTLAFIDVVTESLEANSMSPNEADPSMFLLASSEEFQLKGKQLASDIKSQSDHLIMLMRAEILKEA